MSHQHLHQEPAEGTEPRNGVRHWRSAEESVGAQEFHEKRRSEFPVDAEVWEDSVSRRRFLQLMGASFALAGVSGCVKQPEEKILPYVKQPEYLVPGRPLSFATAYLHGGFASGVLVTSHMGRPTKIEGNPDHPASLGSAGIFAQASILTLYDPDRSRVILHAGEISTWSKFLRALQAKLDAQAPLGGAGIRILTPTVTSPTLGTQIQDLLKKYPQAQWHQFEPVNRDHINEGSRLAFGEVVQTRYHFDRAAVVLSLDADFLGSWEEGLHAARHFSYRRKVSGPTADMNRLYAIETMPGVTGGMADHRLRVKPSEVARIAFGLAERLGMGVNAPGFDGKTNKWLDALARDLRRNEGASIVVAGREQPAEVHALVHAINVALKNTGSTVTYSDPVEQAPVNQLESLRKLADDLEGGNVDLLLVGGTNPVYGAPADLKLQELIGKAGMSIHLGLYVDETAALCEWHVPESHSLESWSDARAFDGTVTICQPLIAPLYSSTRSLHEMLEEFVGRSGTKNYHVVRSYWASRSDAAGFDAFWKTSLHNGVVAGTMLPAKIPVLKIHPSDLAVPVQAGGFELCFRPDPCVWDGVFSNNGWLQELPKPVSKITWDNALFLSPSTAEAKGMQNEDVVEITVDGRTVSAPVWILPGHADDCGTLHLGYGRAMTGIAGNGIGVNANLLRSTHQIWTASGAEVRKTGDRYRIAVTQDHHSMEGRPIVRTTDVEDFRRDPAFAAKQSHDPGPHETLYPPVAYEENAWGMTIDLNACTGCNACMIACQSENNIPIVGKTEVLNAREMHWIRLDRYFDGDINDPAILSQPVPCMHCENAPCEPVCPVAATTHDHEGLNVMTYNRCVGTRYCSNNCPYKVRRFNFLQYSDTETESLQLMRNPDVTVRNRGVMEKCTYCVQRISAARITAKKEGRDIRDGEVVTACQSACPTEAIVFGSINDPKSRVSAMKADPREYSLLSELNTKPRTSYLARLRNPNPELEEPA
jgi:molybdopterin-containing oxidoreductase family iron-sulfur binding subunit